MKRKPFVYEVKINKSGKDSDGVFWGLETRVFLVYSNGGVSYERARSKKDLLTFLKTIG